MKPHLKSLGRLFAAVSLMASLPVFASSFSSSSIAAGDGESLQTRMFSDDLDRALTEADTSAIAGPVIGAALEFEHLRSASGRNVDTWTVPLSYAVRSDLDPRRQTIASLRLVNSRADGSDSRSVIAGMAFRRPITDAWTLVPAVSVGHVSFHQGNIDSYGSINGGSLSSIYKMSYGQVEFALANMLAHYRTNKFRGAVGAADPELNNTITRNGIIMSVPTMLSGRKLATEVALLRTDVLTGHRNVASVVDYYNEVSVTLGNNRRLSNARSFIRGGIAYIDGQGDLHGLRLKFGYWF